MTREKQPPRPGSFRGMFARLRGRPDSEHEMSFNRVAFSLLILITVLSNDPTPAAVVTLFAHLSASVVAFVHIMHDPRTRVWRRLAMMAGDIVFLSVVLHQNGAAVAGFFPIYLWVTFGNGFRFGLPYLYTSSFSTIVAFACVAWTTPFWYQVPELSVGLLIGLFILPAYAGTLIRKLSKAKQEAEEASQAKSYFLASVSHELRTPLTAIIGLGEHLRDSHLPAEDQATAGTIVSAGRSLLSLINQLLDFARLGAQGLTIKSERCDLPALLESVRALMQVPAGNKGLRLSLHYTPRTPRAIMTDEAQLRDVLTNLIGNAIKFTAEGSVTISADAAPDPRGGLLLRLAVTDTGIGIAEEAQAHVFESFRQADHTIIDRFGGTGLGLAICKQIAESMGGEIGLVSAPGKGSRFWFTVRVEAAEPADSDVETGRFALWTVNRDIAERLDHALAAQQLPLARVTSPAECEGSLTALFVDAARLGHAIDDIAGLSARVGAIPLVLIDDAPADDPDNRIERYTLARLSPEFSSGEALSAARLAIMARPCALPHKADTLKAAARPLSILFADDNATNQKVFATILNRAGHSMDMASDGEAALDKMRDETFDAVLMDVNMPVLNGIEATKLFRFASLGRKRLPIIGVTADASPETAERCLAAGMDACVEKPVDAAELLALLDRLCALDDGEKSAAFDPSGVVTPIIKREEPIEKTIDPAKIVELEEIGGPEFVGELFDVYLADADSLLEATRACVARGDAQGFRDATHALRSSGANVGALRLAEMCKHFQKIDRVEYDRSASQHVTALEDEVGRVRNAIATILDERRRGAA